MIQLRQKLIGDAPDAHAGDIVFLIDYLKHRNDWPLARIAATARFARAHFAATAGKSSAQSIECVF